MASIPSNGYAEVMSGTNNYSGSNSFDGSCPRTAIPPVIGDDLTNKTYVDNATGGGIIGTLTDKGSLLTGDGTQTVIFDQNPYQTALTTTTVYDWNSLALGQSRQFTTTVPTLLPLGAGITITYSGTDSIKGNITAVAGTLVTLTITAIANTPYSSAFLLQTAAPNGAGGDYTDVSFPFNPAVTTPLPPNIPANTIITDGEGFISTSFTTGIPVSITANIIGSNIQRPSATPFTTIPLDNPTVNPQFYNFPSGCFVGTTQSPSVQFFGGTYRVGFPNGGTFAPPNYVGSLSGYTVGYSTGSIVIDDDIALIADAISATGLAWGVINPASIGAVTSVSGGVNIVMSGTVPAPVVNLRNPLTAELNMGSQSFRDSASSVGTSGQLLSAGTGGQTLWTNTPPANPTITDTNTNATFFPTFVAGSGTQPLLADISTGAISLNPSNGDFNVVDTLKLTQTQVAVGKSAGATSQGGSSVAIGFQAGQNTQGVNSVAIGLNAGLTTQGASCVAIGNGAGTLQFTNNVAIGASSGGNQGNSAIAIGFRAGQTSQGIYSIAVGLDAGKDQGQDSISVGRTAGQTTQGTESIAIGFLAGTTTQGTQSIAVGRSAGATSQGTFSVAVGYGSGATTQGANSVSVGVSAGNTNQGANSVAIGINAGNIGQLSGSVAVGNGAGQTTQGTNSVAVGLAAGSTTQGTTCVSVGAGAGQTSQGNTAVAIGSAAGSNTQSSQAVAVGSGAGITTQGQAAVAVGINAGAGNQGLNAVAIGRECANTNQGSSAVAIGNSAGQTTQGANSVAVGLNAGRSGQLLAAVAIGNGAGEVSQGIGGVAVGSAAGQTNQSQSAVAVGSSAGFTGQGQSAVAIGISAGSTTQGNSAVSIGSGAGQTNQQGGAIAIGSNAGNGATSGQGSNSIAIGTNAGTSSQTAGSICLNATGLVLNPNQAGLFIDPIRNVDVPDVVGYNPTTKEVTYFDETNLFSVGTPTASSPVISDAGGNINSGAYNIRVSEYVKIGKLVFYQGNISITAKTGLTGANTLRLSIPFTSDNTADFVQSFPIGRMNGMTTNIVSVSATIAPNTDFMVFFIRTAASADASSMTVSDISATWSCRFGGFYLSQS